MASATPSALPPRDAIYGRQHVWQLPVRLSHWVNVVHSHSDLFDRPLRHISQLAPAGEPYNHLVMGTVQKIHFVAGFILLFSFLMRVYWFYVGNNYARSGFPFVWRTWWVDLIRQALHYLQLERGHVHLGHNALAGLSTPSW